MYWIIHVLDSIFSTYSHLLALYLNIFWKQKHLLILKKGYNLFDCLTPPILISELAESPFQKKIAKWKLGSQNFTANATWSTLYKNTPTSVIHKEAPSCTNNFSLVKIVLVLCQQHFQKWWPWEYILHFK